MSFALNRLTVNRSSSYCPVFGKHSPRYPDYKRYGAGDDYDAAGAFKLIKGKNCSVIDETESRDNLLTHILYQYKDEAERLGRGNAPLHRAAHEYSDLWPFVRESYVELPDRSAEAYRVLVGNVLEANKLAAMNYKLELPWFMFRRLELYDAVTLLYEPLGIDVELKVIGVERTLKARSRDVIEIGARPKDILEYIAKIGQRLGLSLNGLNGTDGIDGINPMINLPELLDDEYFDEAVGEAIAEYVRTPGFINDMRNVTKMEVLAAETIHAANAFIVDLVVERVQTNLWRFVMKPNLVGTGEYDDMGNEYLQWGVQLDEETGEVTIDPESREPLLDPVTGEQMTDPLTGEPMFVPGSGEPLRAPNYIAGFAGNRRNFIRLEGITLEFVEQHLGSGFEPFTVNGRQAYWTAIEGGPDPYTYVSFTEPREKYPDITDENAEFFKVMMKNVEDDGNGGKKEFVKARLGFKTVEIPDGGGGTTLEPEFILGTGDENGNGQGIIHKFWDGSEFLYTVRTASEMTAAGAEIGIRLSDDGCWYYDIEDGEWKLIGSGGGGGAHGIILTDAPPTPQLVAPLNIDDIIMQYDPVIEIRPV